MTRGWLAEDSFHRLGHLSVPAGRWIARRVGRRIGRRAARGRMGSPDQQDVHRCLHVGGGSCRMPPLVFLDSCPDLGAWHSPAR